MVSPAFATVHFLSGTASGTHTGASWANAWTTTTQMNAGTFAAGDIICMAGGTYSGQGIVTNASGSSGSPIVYKRATAADANCGSSTSGWLSGFDSTVVLTGGALIQNSFITVSGNGVAGGISMPVANASGGAQFGVDVPTSNITITYLEFAQTGCGSSGCNQAADTTAISMNHFNGSTFDLQTNWLIDHVNMHGECTTMQMASSANLIIQYSRFADSIDLTPGNPNCHPNTIFYSGGATTNITFRYNEVVNNQVEGILSDAAATWDVYGNIIHDPFVTGGNVSRFFEAQNSTVTVHEYNNTFVGYSFLVNNTANSGTLSSSSVSNNNIYINSATPGLATNDFDAFNGSTGGETHGQNIATTIFVNFSAGTVAGYALASDTAAGTTLSSPFNNDINGTVRGVNGIWDRGYFQRATSATTWYIRQDGGTNTQCTGKVNAAYPGSGSAQPCAFNHPFQMMNFSGGWANMVGGDTIQFADPSSFSHTYYMGEQNSGVGTDWHSQVGGVCGAPNGGSSNSGCILPILPSGTASQHTKVLGQNAGSCHDTAHSHLVNPTILSGISAAFDVLDVRATNYVDISCVEVTQPDSCTAVIISPGQCNSSTSNYVGFGGLMLNYQPGTPRAGASNLTLTDFAAVGISSSGILGSALNTLATDVTTWTDVYVIANGQAGWNADSGGCGTSCETVGTVNIHYSTFDWNGCVPKGVYDMTKPDTQNGYNFCTDQQIGGYGDGFVTIASGNMNLNVDHSFFRWNTQDGFDSLHLSDDPTHSPNVSIDSSWSEGNEGQTFKLGAGNSATATNNVSINNCLVLATASNFPLNSTGWNTSLIGSPYLCRAQRDEWAFQLNTTTTVTLENNTSVGYGTTMYDVECSGAAGQSACAAGGAKFVFKNNISLGFPDPGNSSRLPSGFFLGTGVTTAIFTGTSPSNNLWFHMFSSTGCPDSVIVPTPTANQCGDPLLVGETNIDATDPNVTGSSPALAHGVTVSGVTLDYNGTTRPNPPAIGGFETSGSSPITVANPTCTPAAGTYSSTQSVTCSSTTGASTTVCTIDGSTPTHSSSVCSAVAVASSLTLKALSFASGDFDSSVVSNVYTITTTVATPGASPAPGNYVGGVTVTLSDGTSGSTICYTVDGTTPAATTAGTCSHGTTYSGTFNIITNTTVLAIGTKSGSTNSSLGSFAYTITPIAQTTQTFGMSGSFGVITSQH
jgi:hypothetical protein